MRYYFMEISPIFAFKFPSYWAINFINVQPPFLASDLNPAPPTHIQVQSYLVSKMQQTYVKTIHPIV